MASHRPRAFHHRRSGVVSDVYRASTRRNRMDSTNTGVAFGSGGRVHCARRTLSSLAANAASNADEIPGDCIRWLGAMSRSRRRGRNVSFPATGSGEPRRRRLYGLKNDPRGTREVSASEASPDADRRGAKAQADTAAAICAKHSSIGAAASATDHNRNGYYYPDTLPHSAIRSVGSNNWYGNRRS
jgi:hypothetical protein